MKNLSILLMLFSVVSYAQERFNVSGKTYSDGMPLPYTNVVINKTDKGTVSDDDGNYVISGIIPGTYTVTASFTGFKSQHKVITINNKDVVVNFNLEESESLEEVVVTGTLKPVSRLESPVPVEVYSTTFLKKNPTANVFEALQTVNGVRPQLNCNVCNTGDIHINGLEGPYTLVLIDGMPIVSGLSTVYGLSGIPNSLIEQVEIVKGPASSLYGSEAVGGLINIITKLPEHAPQVATDVFTTGWGETNFDLGLKSTLGKKLNLLFGSNYYNYSNPIDNNGDNFTDVTLQDRVSVFLKGDLKRPSNKKFSIATRFFYEDRWGGEMQWNKNYRGGGEVYGESIYTTRYELLGNYQLPVEEKMLFQFSYTDHDQNSVYGDMPYLAQQRIGFAQLTWDKAISRHDMLFGVASRYNFYNDNTPVTVEPDEVVIPSVFVQDEMAFGVKHKLLLGARYDYDKRHGNIFTPRIAYKYKSNKEDIIRLNLGTGFRVVNLFAEEHAALTGARDVVIEEELKPERSYNINLNYMKKFYTQGGMQFGLDASAWYTYFTNLIIPDYDTDPNEIIYDNLDGSAVTTGVSVNVDATFGSGIKLLLGATYQDVSKTEGGQKEQQMLTEKFSGTWAFTYKLYQYNLSIDYTGNIYGPMRLPLLGDLDPREQYSPVWSIQNIQFTYDGIVHFEFYGGVKNLLNWTPNKGNPFIIARANDPFDENITYNPDGSIQATPNNPYALTFDPSYVYAPNQGRRLFLGVRYRLD